MALRLRTSLPSLEGAKEWINGRQTLEQLAGKPIFIHFWAISCRMCKETFPLINEWKQEYGQHQLQVIGVHMPRSEKDLQPEAVQQWVDRYELRHPIILDNEHEITDAFENIYVPTYYLFDESHRLRHLQVGNENMQLLKRRINKLLEQSNPISKVMNK